MAGVAAKALIFLVFCVALINAFPKPERKRIQELEYQVKRLTTLTDMLQRRQNRLELQWEARSRKFLLQTHRFLRNLTRNKWSVKRMKFRFPSDRTSSIWSNASPTSHSLPAKLLPDNTKAVFVAIQCDEWRETFKGTLSLTIQQTGNEKDGAVTYDAPMNDFYYEAMIPWNSKYAKEITFKATGSSKNQYQVSVTGYITS